MFAQSNSNFQQQSQPTANKKPWQDMGMRRRQYNRMQNNPNFGQNNPKIQQLREMMSGMPQQPGAPGLVPPQMSTNPQMGAVTPGIVPPYQQPGYTDKQIGGPGGMPQPGDDQLSYPGGTPPWVYDESTGGPNPGPQQDATDMNMARLTVEPPMEMGPGFPGGPPMPGGGNQFAPNKQPWQGMDVRKRQYNRAQRNPNFGANNPKIQQLRAMMANRPQGGY